MKLTITLAVLLVIVVVAFIVQNFANRQLLKDKGETKRQLQMKDKQIELKRDSIDAMEQQAEHLRASMVRQVSDARDSVKMISRQNVQLRRNNEKAKAVRVPRSTPNLELDSLVTGFLAEH